MSNVTSPGRGRAPGAGVEVADALFAGFQAPISPKAEPINFLYDMRLPAFPFIEAIKAILVQLGCQMEEARASDAESPDVHQFTLLTKGNVKHPVLFIRNEILKDYRRLVKALLLDILGLILQEYQTTTLCIVYDENPDPNYVKTISAWAASESYEVNFIGAKEFDRQFAEGQRVERQRQFLVTSFSLPDTDQVVATHAKHISQLPLPDKKAVAKAIMSLPEFQEEPASRRILVEMAGLEDVVGGVRFDLAAFQVAWSIANDALNHGYVEEQGEHPYKLLLVHLAEIDELPQKHQVLINRILAEYDFGPDPD